MPASITDRTRRMIAEVVNKIVAEYAPDKIILFGSYAHGHPDKDSDIDLLIVKDTDMRPIDRWTHLKRLLRDRESTVSVSPMVYTPREIEDRLAGGDFFLKDAVEKGVVLYG